MTASNLIFILKTSDVAVLHVFNASEPFRMVPLLQDILGYYVQTSKAADVIVDAGDAAVQVIRALDPSGFTLRSVRPGVDYEYELRCEKHILLRLTVRECSCNQVLFDGPLEEASLAGWLDIREPPSLTSH